MNRSQWVVRLLEIVLASKASNIKAPSDPKEAYRARMRCEQPEVA